MEMETELEEEMEREMEQGHSAPDHIGLQQANSTALPTYSPNPFDSAHLGINDAINDAELQRRNLNFFARVAQYIRRRVLYVIFRLSGMGLSSPGDAIY